MAHARLHGAIFECEACGAEYEDHPMAFAPHLCEACEESERDEDDVDCETATTSGNLCSKVGHGIDRDPLARERSGR